MKPRNETRSPATESPNPYALIQSDMQAVDVLIAKKLHSDVALVSQIGQYIIQSGGKRLRPVLLLLMSQALGCTHDQRFNLAAIIEFIHTATLLHDDVVDESTLRRGQTTANANFGNPASVLVGDFLYSRAFQMMVESGSMRIMKILAEATNVIAEGEVLQLMHLGDPHLTTDNYLQVIRSKTAKLFEASTEIAAVLAQQPEAVTQVCAAYGRHLGTAFQIVDDILDYVSNSTTLGKNPGDDLREGKVTLPFIIALSRASQRQQSQLLNAIEAATQTENTGKPTKLEAHIRQVLEIVNETGAIRLSYECAAQEALVALDTINQLDDLLPSVQPQQTTARQALRSLARDLQNRSH